MKIKLLRDVLLPFIVLLILTYIAFTTKSGLFRVIVCLWWFIYFSQFTRWVLQIAGGISSPEMFGYHSEYRGIRVFLVTAISIINLFVLRHLFEPYLYGLIMVYVGMEWGMEDIRFLFFKKEGIPETFSREIKSILMIELWFMLLVFLLKLAFVFVK